MSVSVLGNLFLTSDEQETETINFLKKINMASDRLRKGYKITDDHFYTIELKENISVIEKLREYGYFEKKSELNINNINEFGINFYIANGYMGDASLFVPMNNIIAIHTVEKDQLEYLKNKNNDISLETEMYNVSTKTYTDLTFKIENIITKEEVPLTAVFNYTDDIFGGAIVFLIQENFHSIKLEEDYKYEFNIDTINNCVVIKLIFKESNKVNYSQLIYNFKIKLYKQAKYTFRKILKNEKMYVCFYKRKSGKYDVKRMVINKFQKDFQGFLDANNIEY